MNEEIAAGIKGAMERGYPLNVALQSFINAGYNPQEVLAAGRILSAGSVTSVAYPSLSQKKEEKPEDRTSLPSLPKLNSQIEQKQPDKNKRLVIIAIISTLAVFLGALGYLLFILLK